MRRALGCWALACSLLLSACAGGGGSGPADVVRVGSEQFAESQLLGEIYAQALEARGVPVERRFGIGSRDAFTITRATAQMYRATSIEDIAPHCEKLIFGGPAQFQDRAYGLAGLQRNYGCTFKDFRPLDTGGPITVAALREGDIQGADLFTTDPAVPANDLVTLADPRNNFPAQNVVPLMTRAKAAGVVVVALDGVSAKLSQKELLNLDVEQARTNVPDTGIASTWLKAQGLA